MIITFKKGENISCGKHFVSKDFDCHCLRPECNFTLHDDNLNAALDALWAFSGPFKIDSGYRCEAHNKEVGGVNNSQHLLGKAADCRSLRSYNGNLMARYAEEVPEFANGGIGIYPHFAHCDVRKGRARWGDPVIC